MKCKNVCNLPTTGSVNDEDGILITQGGKTVRMLMTALRAYIGYASGADVLGVPAPTAADAGKVPAVNSGGTGYELVQIATKADLQSVQTAASNAQNAAGAAASAASRAQSTADSAASAASKAQTAANSAASAASTAQSTANTAKTTADNALPKAGGTMTGRVKVKGITLTSGTDYGTSLPAAGTAGRLFFKKV